MPDARAALRDWAPLVFVAVVFDNLENYTGLVRQTTIDATLYHIDLALFGVEPTVWIRRFYPPLVTDWMASCYGIFLITPMFLAIVVSLRGRREDFREMALAVMLQMWIAFFVFICLPAGPPRYFAPLRDGAFQQQLPSFFGFNDALQATLGHVQPAARARVVPLAALRVRDADVDLRLALRRRRLRAAAACSSGSCCRSSCRCSSSTIYLRHHWIPDIAAGIVLGIIACSVAPWLRARWPEMRNRRPAARGVVRDRATGWKSATAIRAGRLRRRRTASSRCRSRSCRRRRCRSS